MPAPANNQAAVQELEARLKATHGGVAEQSPFHLPSHLPPGVPKTCYDEVPPAMYLGPHGVRHVMRNRDGLALQAYFWPAPSPKAVLVFCHGHGAHVMFEVLRQTVRHGPGHMERGWAGACRCRRRRVLRCAARSNTPPTPTLPPPQNLGEPQAYEGSWAQLWNAAGISLCGIDLQGCGRSEGKRGLRFYADRFEDYVADVLQLAR